MSPLRAAVVGAGHLGRFHARKYAASAGAELVAVVDTDAARAHAVAGDCGTQALGSHHALHGRVDVASVVVPTRAHFEVARDLLQAGIHVLVEKPMTATLEQARELVELAAAAGRVLQVGHIERFNPVTRALLERADAPAFIECHRISRFPRRGTDTSVVLDLMIHDIDLVLALVGAPIAALDASGGRVLCAETDIANARLRFVGGCVANITASRVSLKSERRLRLFQHDRYLAADLAAQTLDEVRVGRDGRDIHTERIVEGSGDPLAEEIHAFLDCVRSGTAPTVGGDDGLAALRTAHEILRQIEAHPLPGGRTLRAAS